MIERATAVLASEAPAPVVSPDLARFRDAQVDLGRALIRHHDEEDLVIPCCWSAASSS